MTKIGWHNEDDPAAFVGPQLAVIRVLVGVHEIACHEAPATGEQASGDHVALLCAAVVVRRLCTNNVPVCPAGGTYLTCAGLVCPALSSPCADGLGCCNDCGQIGPRGCSVCEQANAVDSCRVHGLPRRDVCSATFRVDGQVTRLVVSGEDDQEDED